MGHPKNKGDRIYQKRSRKEKSRKRYSTHSYSSWLSECPVYAKNRGCNWPNWPLNCNYNSPFYNDFFYMKGDYSKEPFYISYNKDFDRRCFVKKLARRQERHYKLYQGGKKSNLYKKVSRPIYWWLY